MGFEQRNHVSRTGHSSTDSVNDQFTDHILKSDPHWLSVTILVDYVDPLLVIRFSRTALDVPCSNPWGACKVGIDQDLFMEKSDPHAPHNSP